jgi:hypothetical protein
VSATPISPRDGPHLIWRVPGRESLIFAIPEGRTTIGRLEENDLRLDDQSVSRRHCCLLRRGGEVRVENLSERSPARIGREPAHDRVLKSGDVLRLGRFGLEFRASAAQESHAPPSQPAPGVPGRARGAAPRRRARRRRSSPAWIVIPLAAAAAIGLVGFLISRQRQDAVDDVAASLPAPAAESAAPTTAAAPAPPPSVPVAARADAAASRASEALPAAAREDAASASPSDATGAGLDAEELAAPEPPAGGERSSEAEKEAVPEVAGVPLTAGSTKEAFFDAHVVLFLRKYCTSCHGSEDPEGDLALDAYTDAGRAAEDRKVWEEVAKKLRGGAMPPKKEKQPTPSEVGAVIGWIDAAVFGKTLGGGADPGRVTMRRLNKLEYNHTIRDLFGLDLRPADEFPADEIGYGFDNNGDVLSIPPLLMDKYLAAAGETVRAVWKDAQARERVLVCEPKDQKRQEQMACAQKVIRAFAERAFRRPLLAPELSRLTRFVEASLKDGEDWEAGIRLALEAVLVSPHFLFRVELDSRADAGQAQALNDFELASRLSYFLWASAPDAELFELARAKQLGKDEVLEKQARRMLADPKASGLVAAFGALWLGSRTIRNSTPDPATYSNFDEELRRAMAEETELFFAEVAGKDMSILTFLDAGFTFLNERLARHYGISGVEGPAMRRVELSERRRGGVLTQGTVLTVTSNPTRTSPVKRGRWILEQILGSPPPPPPPGADSLAEPSGREPVSLRQRMEEHRRNPECASCHERMDSIGLAFEHYDGIGAWRDRDNGLAIDASGRLPDGRAFKDAVELKAIVLEFYKADFCRSLTEKLLTFALGRGLEYSDTEVVDSIAGRLPENGYRFSALVLEIVKSELFRKRRGERLKP